MMYEMVTGWPPFGDTRADPVALAQAHQNKAPTPPRARVAGVPATLEKLIMALLAKDPEHRPHNASAVVRVIKEVEQDLDASGPERRADGPSQGPGAPMSDNGFADQLSAAELAVRQLVWKHGQDHALVITARMELADLTGHSGDVRGAAELYDRLGRDCSAWFGPGHSRTLDAFEGMARWVSA
ncbi:hypothetical protein QFZ22_003893 [Streptomyces canus]|uniref:Protein kinase domain-containing protein n=1 Tax=Streptomyces canus TaxID=58343 RepID=A0AAW8FEI6_9ACTN|nr:hypothetical protein [Streptomyces canus]MDQ0907908.1 hypothetical protein [Streptomyces canus]